MLQSRQAADGLFNRKRDLPLDLFRAEGWNDGVDLNLDRRRVGKGVNVEKLQRDCPGDGGGQRAENHQHAIPQREVDDVV